MRVRRIALVLFLVSLLLMATGVYAQQDPTIMPTEFLRSWDPITLVFASDVGPRGGGPADDPGELFSLQIDHPGEYRWVDAQTLQFLPADPWPPLETIRVVSGDQRYALQTLMAPPLGVAPSNGSSNLEPVDRVVLTLPARVDPQRLASMIEIETRPLPGLELQETIRLDRNDFSVSIQDPREGSGQVTAVVRIAESIGYGREIEFSLRLAEGAAVEAHVARYQFSTRPLFRLTAMGSGSVSLPVSVNGSVYSVDQSLRLLNQTTPLYLQFSEPLDHVNLEQAKRMVSFSPAIRNFSYEVANNRLYLHVDADSETPYDLRIDHEPLLSSSGRALAPFARSGFSFYFQRLEPYLRWEQGQAVVERFGPQVFPMEGRGVEQVDLRVYRIDPLDRQFWPFSGSPLSVNEEARPPMPGDPIDTRDRAVRVLGSPDVSSIITLPIERASPATEFGLDLSPYFTEISGENAPGTYLVGYRALGNTEWRQYVRIVVTDLNLSVVEEENAATFFVTSLATGLPIAGALVTVEGQDPAQSGYVAIVQGTTDADGAFKYEHQTRAVPTVRRITLSYGDDTVSFDPSNPPPTFGNNHWYGSTARWLSWLNQNPRVHSEPESVRGYLLTERPIYRPEEPVHLLGYVRSRKFGAITMDTRVVERRVDIRGPGNRTWTFPVELDGFGQFSFDFHEDDVPTGTYIASLYDAELNRSLASVDFQIESYRVPRFEVQIHGADRVPVDEPFELTLVADYYAGGRVIGRPVLWRVTESSYRRDPVGYPGFAFSSYESIGTESRPRASGITRQDVTDETGLASIIIDPTTRQSASAARFVVEGTVEGADGQSVTAVRSVVALPPFSVGIRQERFVRDGPALTPEVVVLDFDARPLAGVELLLRVYQRQWHSYLAESDFVTGEAEYRSDVVDELIHEETHVSVGAASELSIPVEESGVYLIEVLARDNLGRLQTVRVDTYIPGESPVAWERTDGSVFRSTADKDGYVPGDVASVLLHSPSQEATALAVVEGPTEIYYEWIEINAGQALFEIPIRADMVPRLPVHFLLMRGRVAGTESRYSPGFDRARPIAVANTTYLTVLPVFHEIDIGLDYPDTSLPGSTIEMEIRLSDYSGDRLDGQVALWLVDRAVLSLAQEKPIEPLNAFIDPATSAITIRDTRNEVVGNLPFRENPGGGGWEGEEASSILDRTTVRRNFQSVPYFNPTIPVSNGRATIEIALPDNLTDFAVRAVAVSGYSQFGTASGLISVRLPVIMQTALPRFVRPGDQFSAGGVARIVEGPDGPANVQIRTEGVVLDSGAQEATRAIDLDFGVASNQYFPMSVPQTIARESVTVSIGVERLADGVSDAFEMVLPVSEGVFTSQRSTVTASSAGMEIPFPVEPGSFREGTLRQQAVVSLDRDVISALGGLQFVDGSSRQTTEQWVSGIRAVLKLQTILREVGWDRDYKVSQARWEEFLSYLETVESNGGLYAQFPGGRGLVSLTAWVLDAMSLAGAAELETPQSTYDQAVRSLNEALRSDYQYLISDLSFQERVEALSALGRADSFDSSYGQQFLTSATSQNLYSAALVVSAFAENGEANQTRVRRVADHLWGATTFRLEGGQRYFTGLSYPSARWGGYLMTSDVRTVAAVIRALSLVDPTDDRIPIMVDYLLRQGDGTGWGSTANTMEVLTTLGQLISQGDRRILPNIRFTFAFGRETETLRTANRTIAAISSDVQEPGTITQGSGTSEPWVFLQARYRPAGPVSQIASRNDGFVINRELQVFSEDRVTRREEVERSQIRLERNALVEEHITLSNPEQRYYVAVHVPLASGFEALNPELDTSGSDAIANGRITVRPTYTRFLDDSVTYYYETLPAGTYHFYFRERATFEGVFQLPPAWVEAIYDPESWGNSPGATIRIEAPGP